MNITCLASLVFKEQDYSFSVHSQRLYPCTLATKKKKKKIKESRNPLRIYIYIYTHTGVLPHMSRVDDMASLRHHCSRSARSSVSRCRKRIGRDVELCQLICWTFLSFLFFFFLTMPDITKLNLKVFHTTRSFFYTRWGSNSFQEKRSGLLVFYLENLLTSFPCPKITDTGKFVFIREELPRDQLCLAQGHNRKGPMRIELTAKLNNFLNSHVIILS